MTKTEELKAKALRLGKVFVPGNGLPESRWWIVGEAPGEEEELKRRPFMGKSGFMLEYILGKAHIHRSAAYITNVSPVRPPGNKWERLDETGFTEDECRSALLEEIKRWKPYCVLALGEAALGACTGKSGITAWRGTILSCEESKVVPAFHPAYILRQGDKPAKKEREGEGGIKYTYGSSKLTLLIDTRRAIEESRVRGVRLMERDLVVDPGIEWTETFLGLCMDSKQVAFDIETKGNYIDRIAFSYLPQHAVSIRLDNDQIEEKVRYVLWNHSGLQAQNGMFDMTQLMAAGMPVRSLKMDTMVAHHWLWPELPHDLGYLASTYCRLSDILHPKEWWKDETRGRYNALHSSVTREVAMALEEEMGALTYEC